MFEAVEIILGMCEFLEMENVIVLVKNSSLLAKGKKCGSGFYTNKKLNSA